MSVTATTKHSHHHLCNSLAIIILLVLLEILLETDHEQLFEIKFALPGLSKLLP
jgi:hypothetical protein